MVAKINPTSGNPWRGKDNKFAESPFAAIDAAEAEAKKLAGEALQKLRAKKAEAKQSERDYFAELPKTRETVEALTAQRKKLERIRSLEQQRDDATDPAKAKRAQRKANRLRLELDPNLPQQASETFELENEINGIVKRNSKLTGIDPEMTPEEVAKDFKGWVEKQPEVELTSEQQLALSKHMNPNRTDVDPADLIEDLETLEHNDISGLPLARGTQLGNVRKGDNLKSMAYESFTTDPEVAKVYSTAKQLDRSKKPAVIKTKAPANTKAIIPARYDDSQIAQQEVAIGPGYDLVVDDVYDNGKSLEISATLSPSSHRKFLEDKTEAEISALDSTDYAPAPHSSLNTGLIPTTGVDKAYYDLAQKRKYVQEKIKEVQSNEDEEDQGTPFSFDGEGLDYAIEDHLGISEDFETIEEMEAAIRAKGYDITLTFDPDWEDGKVIGGPDRVKLSRKLYPDATSEDRPEMFEDDEADTSTLLRKINKAEELDMLRNDSRNYKPKKTTADDLTLADLTNGELYDMALYQETQKLPDSPIRQLDELYLGYYVTQQKIGMLQNQFVTASPATRTKLREKITELQRTLPIGVPSYELSERVRAIQWAATHLASEAEIASFIKDSKIKEPVYHSTSVANLGSIIGNGLRAGDGEDAYGKGIYFAAKEDDARVYNNSRQAGGEQVVAKTYINSTAPKILSRDALTEEAKKRLGVKTDWELFKKTSEIADTVNDIINEYYAQGYDSISVRSKDGAVYVIVRDPKKLLIGEWR